MKPNLCAPERPRLLLRAPEAADALGISLRTVMAMVASGEIPTVRISERCLRFSVSALEEWIRKHGANGNGHQGGSNG